MLSFLAMLASFPSIAVFPGWLCWLRKLLCLIMLPGHTSSAGLEGWIF
jgi:hypothetical protein